MRRTVGWSADLQAAAAAGRTVRYRSRSPFLQMLLSFTALMLALGIWTTWFCSGALATGKESSAARPVVIFGVVAGVLVIVLGLWALRLALRPAVTIAAGSLRIPRGAFGTIRVPVSEVTGIGLVAEYSLSGGLPPGWQMLVWHGGARGEPVSIRYTPPDAPSVAAETDPAELADTYAGQVAGDIYQYVLAQQGSSGPLAVTEQQKHVTPGSHRPGVDIVAFWSPDGVVGPAEGN